MIYFKSCLRCKGDVHLDSDAYGAFLLCLQCGFTRDMIEAPRAPDALVAGQPEPAVAYVERKAS